MPLTLQRAAKMRMFRMFRMICAQICTFYAHAGRQNRGQQMMFIPDFHSLHNTGLRKARRDRIRGNAGCPGTVGHQAQRAGRVGPR